MYSLQNWIANLIEEPIQELNEKYSNEEAVRAELDALPLPRKNGHTVEASDVSPEILERLHFKFRDALCEETIWEAVIWYLAHPLPIGIAHDLIDRGVAVHAMAINRQVDEVQWRVATLDEYALYSLIRERYQQPQFSVAQFGKMLEMYMMSIHYDGILYMLSFYDTPSDEKKAIFEAAVVREQERLKELNEPDAENEDTDE